MFNEQELKALLDLLKAAPTTYGVAHGLYLTVQRLFQVYRAVKAGAILTMLSPIEWDAIKATREAAAKSEQPQPSGPQPPPGSQDSPVVS